MILFDIWLVPDKKAKLTNILINVYNEKNPYDLIAGDKGVNNCWTVLKDVLNFWNENDNWLLMKVTNSFYENILCLTWKWIHNTRGCLWLHRGELRKAVKIVWFGVSERGLKLKTTLHGDILLIIDSLVPGEKAKLVKVPMHARTLL